MTTISSRRITLAGIVAVAVVFAALAWQRRWMSDDGLIFVRVVRQIHAGNGPVYNVFERAEPTTSTLWLWLLAAVACVARGDLAPVAVALGGVLSVAGLVTAMDATRRIHRDRSDHALVPFAVLVVLGACPFWDYATSGLEIGLARFWIAAIWWLLVALPANATRRRQVVTAFVFGLGPLVRPDFALPAAVFMAAGHAITRPSRRRAALLIVVAFALALAYEIFRAGYYGVLVPLPALAKSASGSEWHRGLRYVWDFVGPYSLWLPLGVVTAVFAYAVRRGGFERRVRIVIATPLIAAVIMTIYVVRVGGDFMHARMVLSPMLLLVSPTLLVPLRRFTVLPVATIAVWAVVTAITLADGKSHTIPGSPAEDERLSYVSWTRDAHPIATATFIDADGSSRMSAEAVQAHQRRLIAQANGLSVAMTRDHAGPVVVASGRLGTAGAFVPLDGIVADMFGLASPLGARIMPTDPGRVGHEKRLPWVWLFADFADPAMTEQDISMTPPATILAARHAMSCGALAELLASVREPLTLDRFWDNLTGAYGRTTLIVPVDPLEAERTFCR